MCMICIELNKLTAIEASKNLKEMTSSVGLDHAKEVMTLIKQKGSKELDELLDSYIQSLPESNDVTGEIYAGELADKIENLIDTVDDLELKINGKQLVNF